MTLARVALIAAITTLFLAWLRRPVRAPGEEAPDRGNAR